MLFLGMHITKQPEQEIYLIAQESNDGAPPKKTLNFPRSPWVLFQWSSVVCWIAPDEV